MTRSGCVTRTPSTSAVPAFAFAAVVLGVAAGLAGADIVSANVFLVVTAFSEVGGALARSRPTDLASLSSRRPWYDAWRTLPSGVHSAKLISATSLGLTQWSCAAGLVSQRVDRVVPTGNGDFSLTSGASLERSSTASDELQPVPTRPAYCSTP